MRTVVALVVLFLLVAVIHAVASGPQVPAYHLTPSQCAQLPPDQPGC